jgi:hypothetical protein
MLLYAKEEWSFLQGPSEAKMRCDVFYAVRAEKLSTSSDIGQRSCEETMFMNCKRYSVWSESC